MRTAPHDPNDDPHAALHQGLRWRVPPDFNLYEACCGRWARREPEATAIVFEDGRGHVETLSFGALQRASGRLAHALRRLGVQRGDRIALVMPQRFETAIAHMAVYRLGAVAMPLTALFGPEALEYRLNHGEVRLAIVDESAIDNLLAARPACPGLATVIAAGAAAGRGDHDWNTLLGAEDAAFDTEPTDADDAAVLIYTSGTTGPPKGALIPHRALLGNLPGFVCSQNWFPWLDQASESPLPPGKGARGMGDPSPLPPGPGERGRGGVQDGQSPVGKRPVFWSPADWAWTGGLMDALLPSLYFGTPILAAAGRFAPERAFELMARHRVTHTFLFPTALKAMMKAVPRPRERYDLALQAVMSAGEAVGDAVFAWCRDALGVVVNEMFGQTEINYIVGNCGRWVDTEGRVHAGWPQRPGSMGRAYPGHRVAVIDDEGRECPRGTPGDVALHRRDVHGDLDPIFFLGYWKNDDATRGKFTGDPQDSWCRTGDTAVMDEDGYLWYQGRSDDVFKAAGYRIGPSEIENCLVKHPAVANAAVVPKPDPERGALVKAYVVLAPGVEGDEALVQALQAHVRGQLAPYEYPKEIEFIEALPMTTTGKVQRRVLRLQEEERARARAAGG